MKSIVLVVLAFAEDWRLEYNNHRPHIKLGYMTPATFVASCNPTGFTAFHLSD